MADFVDPTPAVDIPASTSVTVAPGCQVVVKVAATYRGQSTYQERTYRATAGKTVDVPADTAAELRALGYVV